MSIIECVKYKQSKNIVAINPKQVTSVKLKQMSESTDVKFLSEKKFLWFVTRKEGFYYYFDETIIGNPLSKEKLLLDYIITEDNKVFNKPSATIYLSGDKMYFFTENTFEEVMEKTNFILGDTNFKRVE